MFKSFNSFVNEYFTHENIRFDVINEALNEDLSKDHKFGICMTTYKIGGDDGGVQGCSSGPKRYLPRGNG